MRITLGLLLAMAAWIAHGATYYIDYATGADANNGTVKTTPWKRAPGMKGFGGSYSHSAGDTFVFKGGVTWPSSCYQWKLPYGGSSASVQDTYTADPTWYYGGSFTRPCFDFEHVAINGWTLGAGVLIQAVNYVKFDNLEFKNHRTPLAKDGIGIWGCMTMTFDTSDGNTVTNCVVRDWDQPTMEAGTSGGGGIMRVNSGNVRVHSTLFHQDNVVQKSGTCLWNIAEVGWCEFRNTPTAVMYSGWATEGIHHNWIHDLPEPADSAAHSNCILTIGSVNIHHNLIHDTLPRAQVIFVNAGYWAGAPGTVRIYDNTCFNVAQPSVSPDTDGANVAGSMTYVWNNTFEGAYDGSGVCVYSGYRNNGNFPGLTLINNHFICNQTPVQIVPTIDALVHNNNLTNTYSVATSLGYTASNLFQPTDATKPTVDTGANLSASFTDDRLGVTRSVPWDIGSYEWSGTPAGSGTLALSAAAQSVSEESGSTSVTVHRTGGTSGTVGVSYATVDGTAIDGVNYTAESGSLTWTDGDDSDRVIPITIQDVNAYGNLTFQLALSAPTGGATLGVPSTNTITLLGSGSPPLGIQPRLGPWLAIDGEIAPPFSTNGGYVWQAGQTTIEDGGQAVFRFVAPSTGQYKARTLVRGESDSYNSFFVGMNGVSDVWHIVELTTGFQERYVGLQGNGSWNAPQFPMAVWELTGGTTNVLTFIGREALTALQEVELELINPPADPVPVVSVTCTNVNGYYGPGDTLGFVVTFAEPVTVSEGTPSLALDFGGSASYVSGSGTSELLFQATPVAGDSQTVDYAATNSLSGAIVVDGTPANLTLPVPAQPGSASYGRSVVWDSTDPTVEISAPSLTVTRTAEVHYSVTFSDTNFASSAITADDVTLNTTGTATATVVVSGTTGPVQTVTLREITGEGTLSISIGAGLGFDLTGNATAAAGPSSLVTVLTQRVIHIQGVQAGVFLQE
ncbi:MAG: Calx-beta domain-containing protein [Verrucomicrobiia bacterium]